MNKNKAQIRLYKKKQNPYNPVFLICTSKCDANKHP